MSYTEEEQELLSLLKSGKLDGNVGDRRRCREYRTAYYGRRIVSGVPYIYKETEAAVIKVGKLRRVQSATYYVDACESDDQKLEFLQNYGWLMEDSRAKAYSARFKKNKPQEVLPKDESKLV